MQNYGEVSNSVLVYCLSSNFFSFEMQILCNDSTNRKWQVKCQSRLLPKEFGLQTIKAAVPRTTQCDVLVWDESRRERRHTQRFQPTAFVSVLIRRYVNVHIPFVQLRSDKISTPQNPALKMLVNGDHERITFLRAALHTASLAFPHGSGIENTVEKSKSLSAR